LRKGFLANNSKCKGPEAEMMGYEEKLGLDSEAYGR
jgi:hypothetical protein